MSETSQVTKPTLRAINALNRAKAVKRHGSRFSEAGDPDIDIMVAGTSYKLEAKLPGQPPTPVQKKRLREWREAGAVVGVIYSKDEAMRIIDGDETMRAEALRRAEIEP